MRSIHAGRQNIKWMTELSSPKNRVRVDFYNAPSLYVARRGWDNRPRLAGQHLVYYGAQGSFRVTAGKGEATIEPGTLLWIPPGTPFHAWLPGAATATFHRFRLDVHDGRGRVLGRGQAPLIVHGLDSARPWIEEIVRTGHQGEGALRAWRLRGALLGLFADAFAPESREARAGRLSASQQEALIGWMNQHGTGPVTPAVLAQQLKLSPDYFARLFQKTFTISPRAWIVRQRVHAAAVRLLESQLSISEVAEEFGYGDIFFFSRQFKQVMGRSPKRYRLEA